MSRQPPRVADVPAMQDPAGQQVRAAVLNKLAARPEHYLVEFRQKFGTVFNADDAATLFDEYNSDRAANRAAVHPAASWIRDELFYRALSEKAPEGGNRVVFTAGGNAVGKSTSVEFSGARSGAQAVLDSTFASPAQVRELVDQALGADKRVSIL